MKSNTFAMTMTIVTIVIAAISCCVSCSAMEKLEDTQKKLEETQTIVNETNDVLNDENHTAAIDSIVTANQSVNDNGTDDVEPKPLPVTIYLTDEDIAKANISDFLTKQSGIHYTKDSNGFYFLETYYSSRVLIDYRINGDWWCDSNGIWHDSDGYIVCAAWGIEGDIINTSLGTAKVYDCSGSSYDTEIFVREDGAQKVIGNVSIYVNW